MKIGAVTYLNTKPLIERLPERLDASDTLILDLPSRLADGLASNRFDIGLIPVAEYFRQVQDVGSELTIVSDAMIGCVGPVRSVRLFFRKPAEQVRVIAADEGSRTSAVLSQILIEEVAGRVPTTVPFLITDKPEDVEADAVLIIGDRAMHPDRLTSFAFDWDLGQRWFETTGLPFVFALWVAKGLSQTEQSIWSSRFQAARQDGLNDLVSISNKYHQSYELTPDDCLDYLSRNLRFQLDQEAMKGLLQYYRRASGLRLLPSGLQSRLPAWIPAQSVFIYLPEFTCC
jgi:chorismate dehydratase